MRVATSDGYGSKVRAGRTTWEAAVEYWRAVTAGALIEVSAVWKLALLLKLGAVAVADKRANRGVQ